MLEKYGPEWTVPPIDIMEGDRPMPGKAGYFRNCAPQRIERDE